MRERWYWLDWLRVLAMGTIFLYHSSRPFLPPVFPFFGELLTLRIRNIDFDSCGTHWTCEGRCCKKDAEIGLVNPVGPEYGAPKPFVDLPLQ